MLVETPFGFWEGNQYSTGIVDLAFSEIDGWVLVDYKSELAISATAFRVTKSPVNQRAVIAIIVPQTIKRDSLVAPESNVSVPKSRNKVAI